MQSFPVFLSGMALSLSLIMAIGPQNAHVLRMGLTRQHLVLTVMLCIATDMVLIAAGVYGFAAIGSLPDKVYGAFVGAGALFLLLYGSQAASRAYQSWRSSHGQVALQQANAASVQHPSISRKQAIGTALAFSWLNPHAWLDTTILVGSASLAYGKASHWFGWGAMTGSLAWFLLLGSCAYFLGARMHSARLWLWLDGAIALMMWALAVGLVASLFRS